MSRWTNLGCQPSMQIQCCCNQGSLASPQPMMEAHTPRMQWQDILPFLRKKSILFFWFSFVNLLHYDWYLQLVKSIPEEQHWIAAPSHSIPDYYQCTKFLINIRISYPGISYYFRQQRSPFIMLTLLLLVACSYHQPCVASSPSEVLAAFSR